jgi:hypothetical protein
MMISVDSPFKRWSSVETDYWYQYHQQRHYLPKLRALAQMTRRDCVRRMVRRESDSAAQRDSILSG